MPRVIHHTHQGLYRRTTQVLRRFDPNLPVVLSLTRQPVQAQESILRPKQRKTVQRTNPPQAGRIMRAHVTRFSPTRQPIQAMESLFGKRARRQDAKRELSVRRQPFISTTSTTPTTATFIEWVRMKRRVEPETTPQRPQLRAVPVLFSPTTQTDFNGSLVGAKRRQSTTRRQFDHPQRPSSPFNFSPTTQPVQAFERLLRPRLQKVVQHTNPSQPGRIYRTHTTRLTPTAQPRVSSVLTLPRRGVSRVPLHPQARPWTRFPVVLFSPEVSTAMVALFTEAGIEPTYEYSIVGVESTQSFFAGVNL